MLAFSQHLCYYTVALRSASKYPGVAKFGIALEWGSRGLEFESRHSDQKPEQLLLFWFFYLHSLFICFDAYVDSTILWHYNHNQINARGMEVIV